MEDKLIEIIVNILDVNENDIDDNFGPDATLSWDSMNNLRLVTAIEEEFNIELSMDEIHSMENFKKIKEVIGKHI